MTTHREAVTTTRASTGDPALVCVLPVRNGVAHLDRWFACARRLADAVVALDDGSTDDTYERLCAEPLVVEVLRNATRPSFEGWNDAENRQRLLDAAGGLRPRWIMQLDADEDMSPDDADALRAFALDPRDHGVDALAFDVHRMIGDDGRWDRIDNTPARMYRWAPGQRLPPATLHLVAVPAEIERDRLVTATVRIRHHAGASAAGRRARYDKYAEVDPDRTWQSTYDHLLDAPGELHEWAVRPPGLPVVRNHHDGFDPPGDGGAPGLSVVVGAEGDEQPDAIERTLRAVLDQDVGEPFEILLVTARNREDVAELRTHFPDVAVIATDPASPPGRRRNLAVTATTGDVIAFLGPSEVPEPGSLDARLRTHRQGWAMVSASPVNTDTRPLGWADYYLQHSMVLPRRPSSPLAAPPVACSYRRQVLDWLGPFPEWPAGETVNVNRRLFETGYGAYKSEHVAVAVGPQAYTLGTFARRGTQRGRARGADIRHRLHERDIDRRALARAIATYPLRRLRDVALGLGRWGTRRDLLRAAAGAPLLAFGIGAETLGFAAGCLRTAREHP